jgi:hypothetical protein
MTQRIGEFSADSLDPTERTMRANAEGVLNELEPRSDS